MYRWIVIPNENICIPEDDEMPEEDEDDADEEEPPAMLVDELKPIPLNCSNIEMYYSNVIIISLLLALNRL